MAGDELTDIVRIKTTYTFEEAIKYMKMKDNNPTNEVIRWVNVNTGKEVIIGYTK
jgi:hypothetical protein